MTDTTDETGELAQQLATGADTDRDERARRRTTEQPPSIGRVVHYVSRGSADGRFAPACRAATITEVDEHDRNRVGLHVVNPTGLFFHSLSDGGVLYDGGEHGPLTEHRGVAGHDISYDGGTWHWPERV